MRPVARPGAGGAGDRRRGPVAHARPRGHPHAPRPRGRTRPRPAGVGAPRHDDGRGGQLQPRHRFRCAAPLRRGPDPRLLHARREHPEVGAAQGRRPHRLDHDRGLSRAPRATAAGSQHRAAAAALHAAHRGDGHGSGGVARAHERGAATHGPAARGRDGPGLRGLLDRRDPVPLPRQRTVHGQAHPCAARDVRRAAHAACRGPWPRSRLAVHARCVEPRRHLPAVFPHQRPAVRASTQDLGTHRRGPHTRAKHLEAVPADRRAAELAARERALPLPGARDTVPHVRRGRDLPDLRGVRIVAAAHGLRHRGRRDAAAHHGDRRVRRDLRARVARSRARSPRSTAISMRSPSSGVL